jgi:hypothetical protein
MQLSFIKHLIREKGCRGTGLFVPALLFCIILSSTSVHALSGSDFRAGNIIADTVFFNKDSMNTSQIQDFLNAKVPNCDTYGTEIYSGSTTRAQYGQSRGYPPPYTCLKSYSQSVPAITNSGSDLCSGSITGGTKSASQIIYEVSQACYVSPQTLIVLLQKEQSLVTDEWPWSIQYRSATGYGCPDTAPCDSEYYGFFNQVYQAAKAYKRYAANPASYNYRAGRNNTILYNPSTACGSSTVYIDNQATAGLYIYTPYQPNQAALNNLYGSGDGCSAYGNRNFWRMFNDWFGNPHQPFPVLDTPRWMKVISAVKKKNVYSGTDFGNTIAQGTQLKFVDKIFINNTWFFRTEFDKANNNGLGIPQSSLGEIPYENFTEPRYMVITQETHKKTPRSQVVEWGAVFNPSTAIKFTKKIYVNNELLYQTAFDEANGYDRAIPASRVADIGFEPLETPRNMLVKTGAQIINLRQNTVMSTFATDTLTMITDKVYINGNWYFRTQGDSGSGNTYGILASKIEEEVHSADLDVPYILMQISTDTAKYAVATGTVLSDIPLTKGQVLKVAAKLSTNGGKTYYQSLYDKNNNSNYGIKVEEAIAPAPSFIAMQTPRSITTNANVKKISLATGEQTDVEILMGTSLYYMTKFEIDGKWYLRTQFDTNNNNPYVIPAEKLNL